MNAPNGSIPGAFMERAGKFGFIWNPFLAEKYLLPLYSEYEGKEGLYFFIHNEYRPEEHPGKRYALQHSFRPQGVEPRTHKQDIYLSFTNQLDYRTSSEIVFRATTALWRRYPEMFTEEACRRLSLKDISQALSEVKYTYPGQGGERWIHWARTLFENLDGDPLNLYRLEGAGDIDELMRLKARMQNKYPHFLNGKKQKLLSLLAVMYEEFERIPPFPRSFPVDLHVQRILNALGVVSWNKNADIDTTMLAEFIRYNLVEFCQWYRLSAVYLSHALWFKGNSLCQKCHELRAKKPARLEALCQMYRLGCSGPKYHTGTYASERTWGKKALLDNTVPGSDGFQLIHFVPKEPRRKRLAAKIPEAPNHKDAPDSSSFILEGEDFPD